MFTTVPYSVLSSSGQGFGQSTLTADPIRSKHLGLFSCPADNPLANNVGVASFDPNGLGWTRGNYVANGGIGPMIWPAAQKPPDETVPGVFYLLSRVRFTDILDGTSNTAFISELLNIPGEDWRGVMHYPEGPIYQHNHTPNSPTPDWIRTNMCVNTDPAAPCIGTYTAWNTRDLILTARSRHTDGVKVGMGDGTVRFCGNDISLPVWEAACTPQAQPGEPPGSPSIAAHKTCNEFRFGDSGKSLFRNSGIRAKNVLAVTGSRWLNSLQVL